MKHIPTPKDVLGQKVDEVTIRFYKNSLISNDDSESKGGIAYADLTSPYYPGVKWDMASFQPHHVIDHVGESKVFLFAYEQLAHDLIMAYLEERGGSNG